MEIKARRDFLKLAGVGAAGAVVTMAESAGAQHAAAKASNRAPGAFEVTAFGAKGDGTTIDTPAINRAIEAAAAGGGGTVRFSAGQYLCYSIRLKSNVTLHLDQGAVIVAADPLPEGQAGGYDEPEPTQPWEAYQDYGHNHWHNSLIWGEELHDISIYGPGRIWGRGLLRSNNPDSHNPANRRIHGIGNKAISLKNCRNVVLKDFQILKGGWFGILATGIDNLLIDGLTIDTNRDGMDIDCCRNVRIANCAVNSPWDDAIVPKSSYALGYARTTENLEISNCYVTGAYEEGTMIDGTWKKFDPSKKVPHTGRIKLGTESNGGFKNIAISNCVFESCRGLALETVDGAICEDIVFTGIAMRDLRQSPLFLRLGARLRGPSGTKVGTLKRIVVSNITSYGADPLCTNISGMPGYMIEDLKISDVYFHQRGGADDEIAKRRPPELENAYPEPTMFGNLPATGLFVRHVRNLEVSNLEVMTESADARPAFWLMDVDGADFFRVKVPRQSAAPAFNLKDIGDFRVFGCKYLKDAAYERSGDRSF